MLHRALTVQKKSDDSLIRFKKKYSAYPSVVFSFFAINILLYLFLKKTQKNRAKTNMVFSSPFRQFYLS